MGWKRLPTYFLNLPLRLLPLSEKQQKIYETTGHLTELAFRTTPKVGKVRFYLASTDLEDKVVYFVIVRLKLFRPQRSSRSHPVQSSRLHRAK